MGLDVEESALDRAALWAADEVFLTSSLRELVPVRRVGPREAWAPGETTRRLHRAFRQAAGARGVPWEDGEA
jgi:branched-chain amino acid aminotransferase